MTLVANIKARKTKLALEPPNSQTTEMLREEWQLIFGNQPNKRISRELLIRAIAYDRQSRAHSGLKPRIARELRRIAGEGVRGTKTIQGSSASVSAVAGVPGTRLVREWRGRMHQVLVREDGSYQWNGEQYSSLSKIAQVITGTRWSGPRFFGLKDPPSTRRSQ